MKLAPERPRFPLLRLESFASHSTAPTNGHQRLYGTARHRQVIAPYGPVNGHDPARDPLEIQTSTIELIQGELNSRIGDLIHRH